MTSSAVTGSSAITILGLHARAIAIITRCRMPPENSCGYSWARSRWIPTSSRSSPSRFIAAALSTLSWMTIGSAIWSPIRFTGFSAFIAPWKMIEMCFHRIPRSLPSVTFARSYPTYSIVPSTILPFDGRRRMIDRAAVVLPQPLSPASPRLSPSPKVKSTPSTARSVPSCAWNCVLRPLTVRSGTLPLLAMGRTSSGIRFSERVSRTPGTALTFSQSRSGVSASYMGKESFAVDGTRVIFGPTDARAPVLRVPERLVVRDLDPLLGPVDSRPPGLRFRVHLRRRRVLDRARRLPASRRRHRGPHPSATDDHRERAVPVGWHAGLRDQRHVLGLRRRERRVVSRSGLLDRDVRVSVRGAARGGPRDGVPAVHRPSHDDPAPLERGGCLRRRRVRRGGRGSPPHVVGRRPPQSGGGRRRGHVPRAEGRADARVDVCRATRPGPAGRTPAGGRRLVDWSRGVPRRHALRDGRVPPALPSGARPLRICDRDLNQRLPRGRTHDDDRVAEPGPVARDRDVRPVRVHPRAVADDRRGVARGDPSAVPVDRGQPRFAVPPPLGADESAQAVTAGTASAGGVTRWHATAFPGPSSMSGGSAQD